MGPKSNDKSPYKRKVTETQAQRRQSYEDGAETGPMELQARNTKDCLETLEAGREAWNGFSIRASSDGTNLVKNLISDFWPPEQ